MSKTPRLNSCIAKGIRGVFMDTTNFEQYEIPTMP